MSEQDFDADEYIWSRLGVLLDDLLAGQPVWIRDQLGSAIRDRRVTTPLEDGHLLVKLHGQVVLRVPLTTLDPEGRVFS
jgi:hypothetical protein